MKQSRTFHLVVERDEDGWFVASVPELPGCHTQARDLDTLQKRAKEAIQLYLEEFPKSGKAASSPRFVAVQTIQV